MAMEPPPKSPAKSSKLPEEKLLPPTEVADASLSEAEIPEKDREEILHTVSKEIRREVRRAHYGLGHPTRPHADSDAQAGRRKSRDHEVRQEVEVLDMRSLSTSTGTAGGEYQRQAIWIC